LKAPARKFHDTFSWLSREVSRQAVAMRRSESGAKINSSTFQLLAGGPGFAYGFSHKIPPDGEIQMAYSFYDAAVPPCAQQLGALAGIIDKAAAYCAANKIEESVLLQDRLYPDMFCLARQIRQSADFGMNTGGRLAGVTPPAMPAVDDTSFAAAKSRVETALGVC
jgi:hypothetical protein